MHRPNIDKIEIVEPPIGELTKKPSRLKYGCLGCCSGAVLLVVGLFIAVRVAVGPGPETLRAVPDNFPNDIPVYAKDNIERISFIPGRYKNRGTEIASVVPKILLTPLLLPAAPTSTATEPNDLSKTLAAIKKVWQLIATPIGDNRDSVQIEWQNLDAEPTFIINYYKNELEKNKYSIDEETKSDTIKQFTFSRADGISGSLSAQGDETNRPGTDYALLIVNLPK